MDVITDVITLYAYCYNKCIMKLKLRRLGNSMAVLIPSITVNTKGWKAGDLIDVVFEPDVDEAERLAEMTYSHTLKGRVS